MNDADEIMKKSIKACRLSYEETAALLGTTYVSLRGWLRPASNKASRPPPKGVPEFLRFLADNKFSLAATAEASVPADMIKRYKSGEARSLAPDALQDLASRVQYADYKDVTATMDAVRRLLEMASKSTVLRILMQARPPVPVAYGFRSGASVVALLTPDTPAPPFVQIEFLREAKILGEKLVDAAPMVFTFEPPILDYTVDPAADVDAAIKVNGLPPGRDALPYIEDAYAALVTHVMASQGIIF